MASRNKGEEKFYKVSEFLGYVNQPDITNISPGYLIRGSQNVVIKDNKRIGVRKGYTVFGAENTSTFPIKSSRVFTNSKNVEHMLRSYDDELEYVYNGTWYRLKNNLNSADIIFAENLFWNTGEKFTQQLFVNGDSKIYSWNGALATFASATANTLTKQGSETWAQSGFIKNYIPVLRVEITSASLTGQALVVTVGSTAHTFTEGVEWNAGSDINASAAALADAINEENNGLIAYSELGEVVISVFDSGDSITSFTGDTNIIGPTIPAKQIVINGVVYTYTGGETTTTLTGVSPNPQTPNYAVGTPIVQAVTEYTNTAAKGIPADFKNNLIDVWNNHVVVGSTLSQELYYSAINEIDVFKIRNPRRTGDGARFTLGAPLVGFAVQKDLTVFAGKSDIYEIRYILSADLSSDTFTIQKAKTSPGEGAQSQRLIRPIKNGILYVSNEPAINFFGSIAEFNDIQLKNISDLIKIDVENFDFTDAHIHYHNREVYFSVPAEEKTLVYDLKDNYWQPPQTLPMRSYQTFNQTLYGFGDLQPETYSMFDNLRDRATSDPDDGFAIPAVANFSYMHFGDREQKKYFNEAYFEGYMSTNTVLKMTNLYELYGCAGTTFSDISLESNKNIFCIPPNDGSLGKTSLGKHGLGNGIGTLDETDLPKVHAIPTFGNTALEFRELGVKFSSDNTDDHWEILTFGYAEDTSPYQSTDIKI